MRQYLFFSLICIVFWAGCKRSADNYEAILPSPNFDVHLYFTLFNGLPYYRVYYYEQQLFEWSAMGFADEKGQLLSEKMNFYEGERTSVEGTYFPRVEDPFFADVKANSLSIPLVSAEENGLAYTIDFKAFEGGVAFRYTFLSEADLETYSRRESSEFILSEQGQIWRKNERIDSVNEASQVVQMPVEFISDNGIKIEMRGSEMEETIGLVRVQEEKEGMAYRSETVFQNEQKAVHSGHLSTPWRILLISKNISDE